MKTCSKCELEKELKEFYNNKNFKDGKFPYCKLCANECSKQTTTVEVKRKASNKYRTTEKGEASRLRQQKQDWYKESVKKTNDKRTKSGKFNAYYSNRLKLDMNFKVKKYMRTRIWWALKKGTKSASTEELLGCTIDQLRAHLESLFTEGMSWDNYGMWHIDHKLPCVSFNLECPIQQRECFYYTNLQPLWALDNIKKGAKIVSSVN